MYNCSMVVLNHSVIWFLKYAGMAAIYSEILAQMHHYCIVYIYQSKGQGHGQTKGQLAALRNYTAWKMNNVLYVNIITM